MQDNGKEESVEAEQSLLKVWSKGQVWFRDFIRTELPWGRESLLTEVPEEAAGSYGVRLATNARVDGVAYEAGQYVIVDSEADFRRLLPSLKTAPDFIFPWYGRLVPASILMPHHKVIDLQSYRRDIGAALLKKLLLTGALVAVAFSVPDLFVIGLIAAVMYGLHPLVELAMAWMRRMDRYSVDELNRRLVNFEFFRRWILTRSTRWLKVGLAVLIVVFLGQLAAGPTPSLEAAALVKDSVLKNGEWWRIVTAGLMHGSVIHIMFNGIALYSLGRVLVALVSPAFLSFVFLFTVVTGSLASLWLGPGGPSVGASGGILGCLGFLLVVTEKFKKELPGFLQASLIQSTLVVAIFGALGNKFIDNAAHGGGLIGGLVLGIVLYPWMRLAPPSTRPVFRLLSWCSILILLGGVVKIGVELAKVIAP